MMLTTCDWPKASVDESLQFHRFCIMADVKSGCKSKDNVSDDDYYNIDKALNIAAVISSFNSFFCQ